MKKITNGLEKKITNGEFSFYWNSKMVQVQVRLRLFVWCRVELACFLFVFYCVLTCTFCDVVLDLMFDSDTRGSLWAVWRVNLRCTVETNRFLSRLVFLFKTKACGIKFFLFFTFLPGWMIVWTITDWTRVGKPTSNSALGCYTIFSLLCILQIYLPVKPTGIGVQKSLFDCHANINQWLAQNFL